jgi:hypothetical protein
MRTELAIAILALSGTAAPCQLKRGAEKPTESQHRRGPNGWEGWTLNDTLPDRPGETFPVKLVLAHNGRVVRQISDGPFIWRWIFIAGGKQVAYETGPLHFSMTCVLLETQTGKRLADHDCFGELPPNAPDWLEQLEASK